MDPSTEPSVHGIGLNRHGRSRGMDTARVFDREPWVVWSMLRWCLRIDATRRVVEVFMAHDLLGGSFSPRRTKAQDD